jgi:phosphatidylserine/phosphatidylglycerophosphate/cardiolipin synthase-like enzyme
MTRQQELVERIQQLAVDLPAELTAALAKALSEAGKRGWRQVGVQALGTVAQPGVRERIAAFLDFWQCHAPDVDAASVALGLLAAAQMDTYHRARQRLDLVWTGPETEIIPLRRTDQALLQLINEANETLHVVCFAVYRVKSIARAIVEAARRGVSVALYLETPDASEGQMAYDTIGALGDEVPRHSQIYIWPLEERPHTPDGRHGSLHAKIALADGRAMLVSSANLTEYAMTLNMEMGLLVRGGPLPQQVERHLVRLVETGVFRPVGLE